MTISILVSTFNRAALLRETLERLEQQHFEPGDELIVVNNASTDNTEDVIRRRPRGSLYRCDTCMSPWPESPGR